MRCNISNITHKTLLKEHSIVRLRSKSKNAKITTYYNANGRGEESVLERRVNNETFKMNILLKMN